MPKYDPNSKAEREAAAASDAGRIIANMANATFDSVREQTERVFQLAAEIGGKDVELADLGDAFSTPGERQDFYHDVLRAAFLRKAEGEDTESDSADESSDDALAAEDKPVADKPAPKKAAKKTPKKGGDKAAEKPFGAGW